MSERFFKIAASMLFITVAILAIFNITTFNRMKQTKVWAEQIQEDYNKKNIELDSRIKEFETNLQELEDKYYEEKITGLLDKEQLVTLAKEQWQYSLTVNDRNFTDYYIYPTSKDVNIILSEIQPRKKILPLNVLKLGSVTGGDEMDKFYDHMIIKTNLSYEKAIKNIENVTHICYSFKDIPSGTIISLQLSEVLREKLGLNDNLLEVIVK